MHTKKIDKSDIWYLGRRALSPDFAGSVEIFWRGSRATFEDFFSIL